MKNYHQGFIALIAVVIVSFLLVSATIVSNASLFSLQNTLLSGNDRLQAQASALSCLDYVALRLAQDSTYSISQPKILTLGQDTCTIDSPTAVSAHIGKQTIHVTATFDISDPVKIFISSLSFL
jgi:hypothetical protein